MDSKKTVEAFFAGETLRDARLVLQAQGETALREYCLQWARGYCDARESGDPRELAKLARELVEKERSPRD